MALFTLTLVRHGETYSNKDRIIQGQRDTELSEKGERQAQLAGIRLQTEKFTHVFTSDLKRASKTCELLMKENKYMDSSPIKRDPRLREQKCGVFEGQSCKVYRAAECKANRKTPAEFVPPEGESLLQLQERVVTFFKDLCQLLQQTRQLTASSQEDEDDGIDIVRPCSIKRRRQSSSNGSTDVFLSTDPDTPASPQATFFMPPQELCLGPEDLLLSDPKSGLTPNMSGSASSTTSGFSSETTDVQSGGDDKLDNPLSACSTRSNSLEGAPDLDLTNSNQTPGVPTSLVPDSDIQASVTSAGGNLHLGWPPNVSLSPVFEHRFSSISSISSGRSASFDDVLPVGSSPVCFNVLAVSHGGCLQQLMRYFIEELNCEVPGGKRFALQTSPNAAISKFTVSLANGNTPQVCCLGLHDKDHLLSEDVAPIVNTRRIHAP